MATAKRYRVRAGASASGSRRSDGARGASRNRRDEQRDAHEDDDEHHVQDRVPPQIVLVPHQEERGDHAMPHTMIPAISSSKPNPSRNAFAVNVGAVSAEPRAKSAQRAT